MFILKNHTKRVVEKLLPDPFLKNQNWAYLWINCLKLYTVCFYHMLKGGLSKYTETNFYIIFQEKYFSYYSPSPDQMPLSVCLYFVRYWAIRGL